MKQEATVFKTLDLPGGSVMPFSSLPGERVRVLYGRIWLTEEGRLRDAVLAPGEEVALGTRGLAVIEALGPARIELFESIGLAGAVLNATRRLTRSLTAWWARQFAARSHHALINKLCREQTMIKLETALFFVTTVCALALAAVVGIQEVSAGPTVQQAVAMPMIKMETVEIVGQRVASHTDRRRRA
jgi:hypothetical protein